MKISACSSRKSWPDICYLLSVMKISTIHNKILTCHHESRPAIIKISNCHYEYHHENLHRFQLLHKLIQFISALLYVLSKFTNLISWSICGLFLMKWHSSVVWIKLRLQRRFHTNKDNYIIHHLTHFRGTQKSFSLLCSAGSCNQYVL